MNFKNMKLTKNKYFWNYGGKKKNELFRLESFIIHPVIININELNGEGENSQPI